MKSYKYCTSDNRTVFSPVPLSYALSSNNTLTLEKLSAMDSKKISIIANDCFAEILTAAEESSADISKWNTPAPQQKSNSWYLHNYCLLVGDKLHIRDGADYKSLSSFMEKADPEELKYVLSQVAMQAALCRAELLQTSMDVVAG